jgi:hypothetical protein
MPEDLDVRWRRARSWLERVRAASSAIEPLVREIAALDEAMRAVQPWQPSGHGGGGQAHGTHSDPTASQAERRMAELGEVIADRRRRLEAAQDVVGECGVVLDRMRVSLSDRHADTLEYYYIDLMPTWSDVADEFQCDRVTVWRMRCEAYEWIERGPAAMIL